MNKIISFPHLGNYSVPISFLLRKLTKYEVRESPPITKKTLEIGSNSDLVLENSITGNLVWTIENFKDSKKGFLTLPTKFDMVDDLLPLEHKGKVIIRMSMNPREIIEQVEFGTSRFNGRINAINKLKEAGYKVRYFNCSCYFCAKLERALFRTY